MVRQTELARTRRRARIARGLRSMLFSGGMTKHMSDVHQAFIDDHNWEDADEMESISKDWRDLYGRIQTLEAKHRGY